VRERQENLGGTVGMTCSKGPRLRLEPEPEPEPEVWSKSKM